MSFAILFARQSKIYFFRSRRVQEIIYVGRERFVRLEVAMELGERITPRP